MGTRGPFVGRDAERARLEHSLEQAENGTGSLVLIAGEAGVGKSRLAENLADACEGRVAWGRATQGSAGPYGPVIAALRSHMRSCPDAFADCGPLRAHLATILPELGEPAAGGDRATLFEAIQDAFAVLAREGTTLVVLDDLHRSDQATLELLPALAQPLTGTAVLVIAAYRSDGLPRDHLLRTIRHELRRQGLLDEVVLAPLDAPGVAAVLEAILDGAPSPSLVQAVHDRTQGVPFFVEEMARALVLTGSLSDGRQGIELAGGEVPVPDTVRDAVLIGAAELSDEGRAAADAAAVAGEEFDLDLVAGLAGAPGLDELLEQGLIGESAPGRGAFRHSLARDALYADLPWSRRRALHRDLAEAFEQAGSPSIEVASQWLGAREETRARSALLRAAKESRRVHAYRDAARAGRQALDLWPDGADPAGRAEALESYGVCAELSGELAEAARAWKEIRAQRADGPRLAFAEAERQLAGIHAMRGDRDSAVAARRAAAQAYSDAGHPADAALQRLAIANQLRATADYSGTVEMARSAAADAEAAKRLDLLIRARGLEGVALAKRGDSEDGLEIVRAGLAQALEHDLTPVAAELYQRLSLVLYDAADYRRAQETLDSALALCERSGEQATEVACVTCLVYVLRECGEWPEALKLGRELIDSDTAVWVAEGLVGMIYTAQGKLSSGRRLLASANAAAVRAGHYNMTVDTTVGLARVAAAEGHDDDAAERCQALLELWEGTEDHHYAVKGLRWSASQLARGGDLAGAQACSEALARISSESGHPDALAALAQSIGETALAEGDADTAAEQLSHAVELHRGLDLPFERAEIDLRAGAALAAAGEREPALDRLGNAYRTARKLGARPLAAEAAGEVAALGESIVRRLGRRAEADATGAGLTRRELEVVRLVAVGNTNREIAQQLFLSPRTVDMHVRNILRKLDSRSRVEATHRAGELGLLA